MTDFTIKIDSTGDVLDVPAEKSILNVLLENGYAVDSSCTSGLCGTCKVRYLDGEPDHRDMILSPDEHTEYLTTCISRCNSGELVLDLPPPGSEGPIIGPAKPLAVVNQDICVACLTCVRACTYGAAAINSEAVGVGGIIGAASVDPEKCAGCGLCAAACPTGAISMTQFSDHDVNEQVSAFAQRPASEPLIVAFACAHCSPFVNEYKGVSASGQPVELEIVDVPCTGRIDNLHLMRTFEDGADAVIISGCEPGRCYHSTGNLNASKRTERVRTWLSEVGLGADRINMVRLPPRDGAAPFAAAAEEMVTQVQSLGPNPLRVCSEEPDPNAPDPEDELLASLGLL
jgi:F420-non-reducing hydrogenase iron-sulfur subunit